MSNFVLICVLLIIVILSIKSAIKHFRVKGGCCGSSGLDCKVESKPSINIDFSSARHFTVTGMSCASCVNHVERAVKALKGVEHVQVNLLTKSMDVISSLDDEVIIQAVKQEGYKARRKNSYSLAQDEKGEISSIIHRLAISVSILLVLMYFTMGHTMLGLPIPPMKDFPLGILQAVLSGIILIINGKYFVNGLRGFIHKSTNMDTLVCLGSGVSYGWSLYYLFSTHSIDKLYFEGSSMILCFITVGKLLESISKGKTTSSLKSLMSLAPKKMCILKDGKETHITLDKVKVDDIFLVKAGDTIGVDGIIIEGSSSINEASITGESIPVDKKVGDTVTSGTINLNGVLKCKALKVGSETTLNQIIKIVEEASSSKAPIARAADIVSGIFVPAVMLISFITFLVWYNLTKDMAYSLEKAISVLVVSCPCSLGLATPVAIMVGNGVGARHGVLFKTATSLEQCGRVKAVAFDKTGTITNGRPSVVSYDSFNGDLNDLLVVAYSLESLSNHPLAKAIVEMDSSYSLKASKVKNFVERSGNGLEGEINGVKVMGGSASFILGERYSPDSTKESEQYYIYCDGQNALGRTVVFFKKADKIIGAFSIEDMVKDDAVETIKDLKSLGLNLHLVSGDRSITCNYIGKKVCGLESIHSDLRPEDKANFIRNCQSRERIAFVGDGINDSPSLVSADVGIAIDCGTDIAVESAGVVLINNELRAVYNAIKIGRSTLINIYENLFWAFFYNALCIPLAAGVFKPMFNLELKPMFAALAMSLSSFCVVTNALRLNMLKLKTNKIKQKEVVIMNKVIKVEGMMCNNCEKHVVKALMSIPGVMEAHADYTTGIVKVTLESDVDNGSLQKAIEGEDYKVIGFN